MSNRLGGYRGLNKRPRSTTYSNKKSPIGDTNRRPYSAPYSNVSSRLGDLNRRLYSASSNVSSQRGDSLHMSHFNNKQPPSTSGGQLVNVSGNERDNNPLDPIYNVVCLERGTNRILPLDQYLTLLMNKMQRIEYEVQELRRCLDTYSNSIN